MKKILGMIQLMLLSVATALGQATEIEIDANGRSYQQIADSLFYHLDKGRIPNEVFANRVYSGSYLSVQK